MDREEVYVGVGDDDDDDDDDGDGLRYGVVWFVSIFDCLERICTF
jgi:hypothetical protein